MTFFERFDALAKQNGTSVNAIAKELGIASGTVTAWKQGSEPTQTKIQKIADHFGVTTDYLLGRTDDPSPPGADPVLDAAQLSKIEVALWGEIRELDDEDKLEILRDAQRYRELKELRARRDKV